MSLRRRIVFIAGVTALVIATLGYAAGRLIVLQGFVRLEENLARQNTQRAANALASELSSLAASVQDWAAWDDTYSFVDDLNPAYEQANIGDSTFTTLRLNALIYIHATRGLVFGRAYDDKEGSQTPIPTDLREEFAAANPLLQHADPETSNTGLLTTDNGLLLVASHAILPSDRAGPARGTLVMARYLDDTQLERLAQTASLSLDLLRLDALPVADDVAAILPGVSSGLPVAVRVLDGSSIAGYALLTDIYGNPAAVLRMRQQRDVYLQGLATANYFGIALILAGGVFILTLLFLLDRTIMLRLAALDARVSAISRSGDASARVTPQGSDELADLARAINRMLQAIQQSQATASEATARYQQLFEEVQTAVLVIDATSGVIADANSAAVQLLGLPKQQIVGQPCSAFCPQDSPCAAREETGHSVSHSEGFLRTANGENIAVMRTSASITLDGRPHLLESVLDITERKKQERWLTHMAYTDALTDVPNRRTLEDNLERVQEEARQGLPGAMLLLDVDYFKTINDQQGHMIGDQALVELTRVMRQALRSTDLLARLGGDEFAVLMDRTSVEQAYDAAERLRRHVELSAITANGSSVRLTVSIGVVVVDPDLSVRDLMARADRSMYRAKSGGRNRTVVDAAP
jgi:diguanylate cyclase (GGDEF)-like protein/PAS domain S-box-containing protein